MEDLCLSSILKGLITLLIGGSMAEDCSPRILDLSALILFLMCLISRLNIILTFSIPLLILSSSFMIIEDSDKEPLSR